MNERKGRRTPSPALVGLRAAAVALLLVAWLVLDGVASLLVTAVAFAGFWIGTGWASRNLSN
jgi:hypothetical protein